MRKLVLGALLGLVIAVGAQAGDVLALREGHPQTYVVKEGDTLWHISGMFLDDPWLWPQLWEHNPQIDNPHLIFPGDVLRLVWIDGQPRLVVSRGRDVRLSPQMRIEPLSRAIPAIPLDVIGPFLSRSRIVSADTLERAPYILAGREGHIIAGAGDQVYARGVFPNDVQSFGIYRRGETFIDPETNEFLGIQATDIGGARLLSRQRDVATLALNRSSEEVRRADRVLPEEERRIDATFMPSAPKQDISGVLLAVEGGVTQIGLLNVVILNKGERDGLEPGNLLAIYRSGEVLTDPVTNEPVKVPDFRAGMLMVFRTFDRVSYGLVLRAERPLAVMDRVRSP